jgi:septum formation protein
VKNQSVHHFILASTSPRRRELLAILGLPFSVVSPGFGSAPGEGGSVASVDETPLPYEAPPDLVQRLSRMKAKAVADHLALLLPALNISDGSRVVIIAADTVVVSGGQILGKPQNEAEASHMLRTLRQDAHHVYSGLTVAYSPIQKATLSNPTLSRPSLSGKIPREFIFITRLHHSLVWMRSYSDAEIAAYVATGSPLDKAGAYGIQDRPFAPVERLEGCFASVMGLPLAELAGILTGLPGEIGVALPDIGPLCSQHTGARCCQSL